MKKLCCSCTFLVMASLMICSNLFYALSAPFLPPVFTDEKGVSETWVGIIFAAFSISSIIMSTQVTGLVSSFGQTKVIFVALLLMAISVFCFGFIHLMTGEAGVISVSLGLRFLQGKSPFKRASHFCFRARHCVCDA